MIKSEPHSTIRPSRKLIALSPTVFRVFNDCQDGFASEVGLVDEPASYGNYLNRGLESN